MSIAKAAVRRREKTSAQRNLNPTAPARVAMSLWSDRYSKQNGGSMDFWDTLSDPEKRLARKIAEQIKAAPMDEH